MAVHLDFETYSEVPIKSKGAWRYSVDPSTFVLCAAIWDTDSGDLKPSIHIGHEAAKRAVSRIIKSAKDNRTRIFAWNSFFEMAICANVLGLKEALDPKIWDDTAAAAAAAALPRALGEAGEKLGLSEDKAKLKEGQSLIHKLCKPNSKGVRNTDPQLLQKLYDYCVQDVIAESTIRSLIPPLSEQEREVWELDQRINIRGLRVDEPSVILLKDSVDILVGRANKKIQDETEGRLTTVSSPKEVKSYLEELGFPIESYAAEAVEGYLKDPELPEMARKIFKARQETGKTSTAKYKSLLSIKDPKDHRIRGVLRYHGAATGRWSGALFQPQNLARPTYRDMGPAVELLNSESPEDFAAWAELLYGAPMEVCSSLVRSMIIPSEGHTFVAADYDQIEARVLCWLSGQEDVLEVFRGSGLVYELQAANIYRTTPDKITKTDPRRQIGKVAVLALGYGGGAGAFGRMAENYGVTVSESRAEDIKTIWRSSNPRTVKFWWALDKAAVEAVENPGRVTKVRKIKFKSHGGVLYCRLPSGRKLAYQKPRVREGKFGNNQVTYFGIDSTNGSRKWKEIFMYGGKWAQNITQAVARDIMSTNMLAADAQGFKVVLTVHDEIISETENGTLEEFERILSTVPTWAEGLPLGVGGKMMTRYGKL